MTKRTAVVSDAIVTAVDRDAKTVTLSLNEAFGFGFSVGDEVVLMQGITAAQFNDLANGQGSILGSRVVARGGPKQ